MTPVQRLTADDVLMLWPDKAWPQEMGALAVLEGDLLLRPDGTVDIERVRQAVADRLHLVPRLGQLLVTPPVLLGGPFWADDPTFDIRDHVRTTSVPSPADEATLLRVVERLRRQRLDRSRPLWKMWLLPGLPDRRVGLFVKLHHTAADGIAGVATLTALLGSGTGAPTARPAPWTPQPWPSVAELRADHERRQRERRARPWSAMAHLPQRLRGLRESWPALRELLTGSALPRTSLDRPVGPDRRLALLRADLDEVKHVAHAHGATVNDVLMVLTAAGLGALLRSRDEARSTASVYVPVALPIRDGGRVQGNHIGQMVVPLPLRPGGPDDRLRQVAAVTRERKARHRPPLGSLFRGRLSSLLLLKIMARHPVSVTTANLPGPREPLSLAGARVLELFPVLPLIGRVTVGMGALSYAGQYGMVVVADRDACPDLETFAAGARDEFRALAATAPRAVRTPGTPAGRRSRTQATPAP